jgi:4-hydroxybenzoate polyprenyltransferase
VGLLLFFEMYFLVILTNQHFKFQIGISEFVGAFTVFGFLLFLRIADDFKDFKTDSRLFPERALPSGRVKKLDLAVLLTIDLVLMLTLNLLFMNNLYFFLLLMGYGALMSVWFFSRAKIQPNLPLALVTHNPIQLIINIYVISYTCIKYGIPMISYANFLILFSLYFDGLVWEIGRKIRAPEDETDYVTYSKLFGVRKPMLFIAAIMFVDLITSTLMLTQLFSWAIAGTLLMYSLFLWRCCVFIRNPKSFPLKGLIEKYLYVTEAFVVFVLVVYLLLKIF